MALIPEHKLRSDTNRRVTRSLFNEVSYDERYNFFTLQRWDTKPVKGLPDGLVSFPQTYLKYCKEDPTEYTFALAVFGDWDHWQRVLAVKELKAPVEALRKEVIIAIRAEGFKSVFQEVKTSGRSAFTAAKWLAEKGWVTPDAPSDVRTKRKDKEAQEELAKEEAEALSVAQNILRDLDIPLKRELN
jgi:hypothetical protein